jgi:hypothetical protein
VLGVINASPGDLTPVFEAILEKAMRLCGAAFGAMGLFKGGEYSSVAMRGLPEAYAQFRRRRISSVSAPNTSLLVSRVLSGEFIIHTPDLKACSSRARADTVLQSSTGGSRSARRSGCRLWKRRTTKVKRLLADVMLDDTKNGDARRPFALGYRSPREYIWSRPAACPL